MAARKNPRLSTEERNALPASAFALPGRRFPIHDRAHAQNALSRVAQGLKEGTLTKSEAAKVITAVCRKYSDFPTCSRRKSGRKVSPKRKTVRRRVSRSLTKKRKTVSRRRKTPVRRKTARAATAKKRKPNKKP